MTRKYVYTEGVSDLARKTGIGIRAITRFCEKRLLVCHIDEHGRYRLRTGQEQRLKDIYQLSVTYSQFSTVIRKRELKREQAAKRRK